MSAQNFEHNVQQKMEELKLVPSTAVWNGVEAQIRKDKKRRRLLFLLPTVLLLSVMGWWVSSGPSNSSNLRKNENSINHDTKSTTASSSIDGLPLPGPAGQNNSSPDNIKESNKKSVAKGINDKPSIENTTPSLAVNASENATSSTVLIPAINTKKKLDKSSSRLKQGNSFDKNYSTISLERITKHAPKSNQQSKRNRSILVKNEENDRTEKDKISTNSLFPFEETSQNTVQSLEERDIQSTKIFIERASLNNFNTNYLVPNADTSSLLDEHVSSSIPIEKNKQKMKSPWHFGVIGQLGASKILDGSLLNAFEKSVIADAAAFNGNVGLPGPVNLQSRAPLLSPAAVNAGLTFSMGGFVERKIRKRLNIYSALQYNYYSTTSKIGYKVDSAIFLNNFSTLGTVNNYYRNEPIQTYTSKYHFVEIPLMLQWRITPVNKFPFFLNAGTSLGYLFTSNALHYDGSYGVYYADKNLYNKWQIGFSGGLTIRLFSSGKHPIEFGPNFRYNTSSLVKASFNNPKHLLVSGLSFKWYIK